MCTLPMLDENTFDPLDRIALCISGGGFRATAFSLGALKFASRFAYRGKSILDRVSVVSAVSGGCITGAFLAKLKAERKAFDEAFEEIYQVLGRSKIIDEVFHYVDKSTSWNPYKRANVINAFALAYDKYLFKGLTLGELRPEDELLFIGNCTDFKDGLLFGLQNNDKFGTKLHHDFAKVWPEVKLADIVAASTCFPGAYGPIGFPGDFRHEHSPGLNALSNSLRFSEIGLMDGGIVDNQGVIKVMELPEEQLANLSLIWVVDVSHSKMDTFKFSKDKGSGLWNWNIENILEKANKYYRPLVLGLFGMSLFFTLYTVIKYYSSTSFLPVFIGLIIASNAFSLAVLIMILRYYIDRKRVQLKNFLATEMGGMEELLIQASSALSLAAYRRLLKDRFRSVVLLLKSVFIVNNRSISYQLLFDNPKFQFRRMLSYCYQFSTLPKGPYSEFMAQNEAISSLKKIPDFMREIATEVSSMPNQLWFSRGQSAQRLLDKAIFCGEFTTCYNMIHYLSSILLSGKRTDLSVEQVEALEKLLTELHLEWERMTQPVDL